MLMLYSLKMSFRCFFTIFLTGYSRECLHRALKPAEPITTAIECTAGFSAALSKQLSSISGSSSQHLAAYICSIRLPFSFVCLCSGPPPPTYPPVSELQYKAGYILFPVKILQ